MDDYPLESVLSLDILDDLVFDILGEVQFHWKGERRVDFDFISFFGIEDDSLKVEDDNFWELVEEGSFATVFFLTVIASISFNILFLGELSETGIE